MNDSDSQNEYVPKSLVLLDDEKTRKCAKWILTFLKHTNVTADEISNLKLEGLVDISIPHDMSARDVVEEMIRLNSKWYLKIHSVWGLWMRNQLRTHGFDEEYFNVNNIDDYYVELVQLALSLKEENNNE